MAKRSKAPTFEPERYDLAAWDAEGTCVAETSTRTLSMAHALLSEVSRSAFRAGKVPVRLTVTDRGNNGAVIVDRPVRAAKLPCHDPEHSIPHPKRRK